MIDITVQEGAMVSVITVDVVDRRVDMARFGPEGTSSSKGVHGMGHVRRSE